MRTTVRPRHRLLGALLVTVAVAAAACGTGGDSEPLDQAEASRGTRRTRRRNRLGRRPGHSQRGPIPPPTGANLADTLPPIDEFPITATPPSSSADEVVEVWSSTEKSGEGSDGWMREVAEDFNSQGITLSDESVAGIDLRYIAVRYGVSVHRPRSRAPRGVHPVEPVVDRNGERVPDDGRNQGATPSTTSPGS